MSAEPSAQEPSTPAEALALELASPELAGIIDLVAYPALEPGDRPSVIVRNSGGAVRLWLTESGAERHDVLLGRDPVRNTDPLAFLPYRLEQADPSPDNADNAYPEPARRLLSFFADPDRSPDLVVVHTPR